VEAIGGDDENQTVDSKTSHFNDEQCHSVTWTDRINSKVMIIFENGLLRCHRFENDSFEATKEKQKKKTIILKIYRQF
jgi:hypothetical protein